MMNVTIRNDKNMLSFKLAALSVVWKSRLKFDLTICITCFSFTNIYFTPRRGVLFINDN